MASIKLLCWNRGTKKLEISQAAWDKYWGRIDSKPTIIFLQEEVCTNYGLLYNKRGFVSCFSGREAGVVVNHGQAITRGEFNFSRFVSYSYVNRNQTKTKDDIRIIMQDLFYFFPMRDKTITDGLSVERYNNEFIVNKTSINTDVINDLSNRMSVVPLNISVGHQQCHIIAVSVHARSKKINKKINAANLFKLLDKVGQLTTGCNAVVVGGDFNVDIIEILTVDELCGFTVPSYDPTIHRAIHDSDLHIQMEDVHSDMIIECPDLVTKRTTDTGQFHLNLSHFNDSFQRLRLVSNHDPLRATLQLNIGPPPTPPSISPLQNYGGSSKEQKSPRPINHVSASETQAQGVIYR
ncbi:uncharacterized protein [Dysidea avara]|uniref:uncharacterized protein n=1 Tax=Dysidea avara TaxID=196820 RepID=UPI00332D7489